MSEASWHLARPARGVGLRAVGLAVKTTLAAGLVVGAAIVVAVVARDLRPAAPQPAPVPRAWLDILKPVRIFTLESPALAGAPVTYTARRHAEGGGREDVLAFGQLDGGKPALRLRLFRRAAEPADTRPLLAAIAHQAAQAGLSVGRSGLPYLVRTRFGAFEAADVALSRPDGTAPVACSGLRLTLDAPAFAITGLACGFTRPQLACLIERLDVASARDDRALIDFFAASELRRDTACAGMRLRPDTLHAAWLDEHDPATEGDKPATGGRSLRRR